MLSKLEEGDEGNTTGANGRPARNSLRDRFKLLRMREEAGITALPDDDKSGGGFTFGQQYEEVRRFMAAGMLCVGLRVLNNPHDLPFGSSRASSAT